VLKTFRPSERHIAGLLLVVALMLLIVTHGMWAHPGVMLVQKFATLGLAIFLFLLAGFPMQPTACRLGSRPYGSRRS